MIDTHISRAMPQTTPLTAPERPSLTITVGSINFHAAPQHPEPATMDTPMGKVPVQLLILAALALAIARPDLASQVISKLIP